MAGAGRRPVCSPTEEKRLWPKAQQRVDAEARQAGGSRTGGKVLPGVEVGQGAEVA